MSHAVVGVHGYASPTRCCLSDQGIDTRPSALLCVIVVEVVVLFLEKVHFLKPHTRFISLGYNEVFTVGPRAICLRSAGFTRVNDRQQHGLSSCQCPGHLSSCLIRESPCISACLCERVHVLFAIIFTRDGRCEGSSLLDGTLNPMVSLFVWRQCHRTYPL